MKKENIILFCFVLIFSSCSSLPESKIDNIISISSLYELQDIYFFKPRETPSDPHVLVVTPEVHSSDGVTFSLVYIQRNPLFGGSRVKCYDKVRLKGSVFIDATGVPIAKYSDNTKDTIIMSGVFDTNNDIFWDGIFLRISKQLVDSE